MAPLRAQIKQLQEQTEKAEQGRSRTRSRFVEADKAGNQDELKKMIGEFAAASANPATN